MRYFDKTFFKFLFGFLLIVALTLGVVVFAESAHATELININTADKTALMTVTGLGGSGVKAQAVIDYRIQHGLFQTIEEIMNVSGIGQATFDKLKDQITVGDVVSGPAEDAGTSGGTATSTSNTSTTTTTTTVTTPLSSHYSFAPVSDPSSPSFTVSAGRERLGFVGVPLDFKAVPNTVDPNTNYVWSFGDGSSAKASETLHAYAYPGVYTVVLNATLFDNSAVSRVDVTIVTPEVEVSEVTPEFTTLTNNSNYEINLYGYRLESGLNIFQFPQDTIIEPGKSVRFPSSITGLSSSGVITLNKISDTLAINARHSVVASSSAQRSDPARTQAIAAVSARLAEIKSELATLESATPAAPVAPESASPQSFMAAPIEAFSGTTTTLLATSTSGSWFITFKHFLLGR